MLEGGCFCGAVRYVVRQAPFAETSCHCSICRRTSGAPFVSWFTVADTGFSFCSGSPHRFQSSSHGARTFCPQCGTQLTFQSTLFPGWMDVTICSLDDPEAVTPKNHTWTRAQPSWIHLADGLPRFQEARD